MPAFLNTNPSSGIVLYLTAKQLCHQLDITMMTLYNWRKQAVENKLLPGGVVRPPIPTKVITRGSKSGILFYPPDVLAWLREWRPNLAIKFDRGPSCVCRHCASKRTAAISLSGGGTRRPIAFR